jgi:hypothetical protein
MKTKIVRALVCLAVLIIGITLLIGCGGGKETTSASHFEASEISFDYPSTWGTASPSSQYALVTLTDPQAKTISITIEKGQCRQVTL